MNRLEIKTGKNLLRIFIQMILVIMIGVFSGVILIGMIQHPTEIESLGFFWILLFILFLLLFNSLIWQINGRLILETTSNLIIIKKQGLIFKRTKRISANSISRLSDDKINSFFSIFNWIAKGERHLKIIYYGGYYRVKLYQTTYQINKFIESANELISLNTKHNSQ